MFASVYCFPLVRVMGVRAVSIILGVLNGAPEKERDRVTTSLLHLQEISLIRNTYFDYILCFKSTVRVIFLIFLKSEKVN